MGFEIEGKKMHLMFPIMKGSMNACMELVGFGTSNKFLSLLFVRRGDDDHLFIHWSSISVGAQMAG